MAGFSLNRWTKHERAYLRAESSGSSPPTSSYPLKHSNHRLSFLWIYHRDVFGKPRPCHLVGRPWKFDCEHADASFLTVRQVLDLCTVVDQLKSAIGEEITQLKIVRSQASTEN